MKTLVRLTLIIGVLVLTGCAGGGGPMLEAPPVTRTHLSEARQALAAHELDPPVDPSVHDYPAFVDRAWARIAEPIVHTCRTLYSTGCEQSVRKMRRLVVARWSVNAYADSRKHLIGVHAGLLGSVGSEEELAYVLAHEAGHLILAHGKKKEANMTNAMLMGGLVGAAVGTALPYPGAMEDYTNLGVELGAQIGYARYSPEMEIEADQFALHVIHRAGMRLDASRDIIVRLARGAVPASIQGVSGWAGYLNTHPAYDWRIAAMHAEIHNIRSGLARPLRSGYRYDPVTGYVIPR